jgi:precorrin-3B C17-methyltransferase
VAAAEQAAAFAVTPGLKHRFTGAQLERLGKAAGEGTEIELTTLQHLIVRMDGPAATDARDAMTEAGLQLYPVGLVTRNIRTCNFCHGDEAEGYPTALALDAACAGLEVPFPLRIGYSGCPNGCSEPLLQDIGVVKTDRGYDLYVGGRAQGMEPRPGVALARGLAEAAVPSAVRGLIYLYQREGARRERFWQFVDRVGMAHISLAAARA